MSARKLLIPLLFLAGSIGMSAKADVLLTFAVTNVMDNSCTGLIQPTCVKSSATSFSQQLRLSNALLGAPANLGTGNFLASEAFFAAPMAQTFSPYTSLLRSRLSGPTTFSNASSQLDSFYDGDSASGQSYALLSTDTRSNTIGQADSRIEQQYSLSYNLSSPLFMDVNSYIDLTSASLFDFFSSNVGKFTGSFDELGANSVLNASTLLFTQYQFDEITGDVLLSDVSVVPEPGSFLLVLISLLAFNRVRTVRR